MLVGVGTFDDAGVYRLTPELALIQTVDFFTPVVDDPWDFGQIAAANALSDVYAMGGRPRTALALVCWPPSGLAPEILGKILAGGEEKCREAGCAIIGGHSIQDEELKYGLAVTGTAHPDRLWTNAAATPGSLLILTKAIGTGILTTALKNGVVDQAAIAPAVDSMKRLSQIRGRDRDAVGVRRPRTSPDSASSATACSSPTRARSRSSSIPRRYRSSTGWRSWDWRATFPAAGGATGRTSSRARGSRRTSRKVAGWRLSIRRRAAASSLVTPAGRENELLEAARRLERPNNGKRRSRAG